MALLRVARTACFTFIYFYGIPVAFLRVRRRNFLAGPAWAAYGNVPPDAESRQAKHLRTLKNFLVYLKEYPTYGIRLAASEIQVLTAVFRNDQDVWSRRVQLLARWILLERSQRMKHENGGTI